MLVTNDMPRRLHNHSRPQSSSPSTSPSHNNFHRNSQFPVQHNLQPQHHQNHQQISPSSPASLPSPPQTFASRAFFNNLPHVSANPSPSDFNGKPIQHYFESPSASSSDSAAQLPAFVLDTSNIPISSIDQYMSANGSGFEFPHSQGTGYPYAALSDSTDGLLWNTLGDSSNLASGVANPMEILARTQQHQQSAASHRRAPSSSSAGSPFQSQSRPTRVGDLPVKAQSVSQGLGGVRKQSLDGGHLPTPTQTPTHDSFILSPANNNLLHPHSAAQQTGNIHSTVAATLAMNSALLDTSSMNGEDVPAMTHSGRHSFSSVEPHPTTPMASAGDMGERDVKLNHNDSIQRRPAVPKLERTITDAYNDELFIPAGMPPASAAANQSYLVHHQNPMITDRLHAAQMARTASSSNSSASRLSPFRAESPWAKTSGYRSNNQVRQQIERPDVQDLSYSTSPQTESEPKTISPKEAMLDYKPEENEVPLFPPSTSFASQHNIMTTSAAPQQQYSTMGYNNMVATSAPTWNASLQSMTPSSFQAYQNFMTPTMALPMNSGFVIPQGSRQGERSPEFPAHLTTMESSASEAAPHSSLTSMISHDSPPKPVDSSAHTGTYSCTYHGCSERFTTPQKLQKHKRDAHRKNSAVTPGVGSGMTAQQLMERNSQTGPHKCERINPTTGKPCNAIFSRPYDLTRHEDTIHNARKQKVRCALCTEEKTFSRADALTRHMRVVHPEVDFPGKHRRRGGSSP